MQTKHRPTPRREGQERGEHMNSQTSTRMPGGSSRSRGENEEQEVFDEIMNENFPKPVEDPNPQTQEVTKNKWKQTENTKNKQKYLEKSSEPAENWRQ